MNISLPFSVSGRQLRLAILVIVAVGTYSIFALLTTRSGDIVWNSPDETANATYAERVATGQTLGITEPLNGLANDIIHPRSTTIRGNSIVPVSFLGFIFLLAGLGATLGTMVIPFVTPVATALTLVALFDVFKNWWPEKVAMVATILASSHAAVIYFASRGLYHNMLFVDAAILVLWGFCRWQRQRTDSWLIFTALMFVIALLIRTSEVVWFVPLAAAAILYERKAIGRRQLLELMMIGLTIGLFMILLARIFGVTNLTAYQATANGVAVSGLRSLWHAIMPFGFHPLSALQNVLAYGLLLSAPLTALVIIGFILSRQRYGVRTYAALIVLATVVLGVYYGSATIHDSVGLTNVTIGNSYVRYWLPLYIGWMPFAAEGLIWLVDLAAAPARRTVLAVAIIALAFSGWQQAYFDSAEGLALVAHRLAEYRTVRQEVLGLTSEDAVIVSDQSDKLFFPARRVITPGDRPFHTFKEVLTGLPIVAEALPTYIYARGLSDDAVASLKQRGLVIGTPQPLADGAWLYPLIRL